MSNMEQKDFIDVNKDENKLEYSFSSSAIDEIIKNTDWFEKWGDKIDAIVSLALQLENIDEHNSEKLQKLEVAVNNIINEWLEYKLWTDIKNVADLKDFFSNLDLTENPEIQSILSENINELQVAQALPESDSIDPNNLAKKYNLWTHVFRNWGIKEGVAKLFWF